MATTGFQKSLLGFDPYELQQQRIKELFAPVDQATTAAGRTGAALGILGGRALFGAPQDPRLKFATEVDQVVKSVMGSNPSIQDMQSKLPALQKAFEDRGMLDQALVIQNQIQKQQTTSLEQERLRAQTEKARAEAEKAGREKEPYVKTSEKFARVGQDILGIPAKANLQEYSQEETALINKELEKMAIKEAESSAAKLSFEGQKKVLGIDEKDAEDYRMQRNASIKQLKALNNMERLLGQGVITGSLQEARTGFLRALDTLGVSTDKARNVISNTEQFDKEVRQLLLGIIKTLGYNPSNADVRFAMDSLPNLTSSASGLQEIVKRFIKANSDTLQESERALTHYRKNNGSFEGFTPNIDIYAPKQITVKDLSDEELQKRLAAARAAAKQAK